MRLDAPMFARAWLAVRQASATKDDNAVLSRTIAIEEHLHGIRLVSTDRYMLLTSWVPSLDTEHPGEPTLDEAPDRTVIAYDGDGRGKGLLRYVMQLARRQETDELPLGAIELRLDFDVKVPAGDDAPETFEGLEPVYTMLTIPDVEKVYLPVVQAQYPDWRGVRHGFTAVATTSLALSPDLVSRVAGASPWADGPIHVTFGGAEKVMAVDYPDSDPHVTGFLMPRRLIIEGDPEPVDEAEPEDPDARLRDALHDAADDLGESLREGESVTLSTSDGRETTVEGRRSTPVGADDEDEDEAIGYACPEDCGDPLFARDELVTHLIVRHGYSEDAADEALTRAESVDA